MEYYFNNSMDDITIPVLRELNFVYNEKGENSSYKIMHIYIKDYYNKEPTFICLANGNAIGIALSMLLSPSNMHMLPTLYNKNSYPRYIIEYHNNNTEIHNLFVGDMDDQKKQLNILYPTEKDALKEYNEIYKYTDHKHAYIKSDRMCGYISTVYNYTPLKGV